MLTARTTTMALKHRTTLNSEMALLSQKPVKLFQSTWGLERQHEIADVRWTIFSSFFFI